MATVNRAWSPAFTAPMPASGPSFPDAKPVPEIPASRPIHRSYMGLIGKEYNDQPVPVLGWGDRVPQSSQQLARILGVQTQDPYDVPDSMPVTDRNTTGWEKDPNQRGYVDEDALLKNMYAQDRPPPPLTLMYGDPTVKGLESYMASPDNVPVNGDWLSNDSGTSLMLNLRSTEPLGNALESYAHNWEVALKQYRPDVYETMRAVVGDVHGPRGRKEDYTYGSETQEHYLERWLRTAANLVDPEGSKPFQPDRELN